MKKKIFLVIWSQPNFYQTLIFLANHLSNKGFEVSIYCIKEKISKLSKNIVFSKRCKVKNSSINIKVKNFFFNFLNLIFFVLYCLKDFLKFKPNNVIFFNQKSLYCQFIFNLFKKKTDNFIYHNFDFEDPNKIKGLKNILNSKIEFFLSNYSDYLIFPSSGRVNAYKKYLSKKNNNYFSFKNCFPLLFKPKFSNQLNRKFGKLIKNKKIICQLGSIGSSHHLDEIVLSGKYLSNNYLIIIGGISVGSYADYLKIKVKNLNLENKILILENIEDKLWFEILDKCSLGLCFYEGKYLSHKNMAGTSQKFNNYLFLNKPMLVNKNNDFKKFKKNHDIYNMLNPNNPKEIAKEIHYILNNKKRYKKIKKNMNLHFKKELNFEKQFLNSYKKILNIQ